MLITGLFLLSVNSLPFADGELTKNQHSDSIVYGPQEFGYTTTPERIAVNGTWQEYKLTETDFDVTVQTKSGVSFRFDKTACSIAVWNSDNVTKNPAIQSDSFIPLGTTMGSSNFQEVTQLTNAPCQTTIIESDRTIEVWGTREASGIGKFVIKYIKPFNSVLKEQIEVTNLNPAWTNHKLGLKQTLEVKDNIKLGDKTYNIPSLSGTILDRQFFKDNRDDVIELFDRVHYDFDLGFANLNHVELLYDGQSKIIFHYTEQDLQILPNETLIIDPTWVAINLDGGGHNVETSAILGADCGVPDNIRTAGNKAITIQLTDSLLNNTESCHRLVVGPFNFTGLHSEAIIETVTMQSDMGIIESYGYNCNVVDLYNGTNPRDITNPQELWDLIGNATIIQSDRTWCITFPTINTTFANITAIAPSIKASAASGVEYTMGWMFNNETRLAGSTDFVRYVSIIDPVVLFVNYSIPVYRNNTIMLQVNSPTDTRLGGIFSADCSGKVMGVNSDGTLICQDIFVHAPQNETQDLNVSIQTTMNLTGNTIVPSQWFTLGSNGTYITCNFDGYFRWDYTFYTEDQIIIRGVVGFEPHIKKGATSFDLGGWAAGNYMRSPFSVASTSGFTVGLCEDGDNLHMDTNRRGSVGASVKLIKTNLFSSILILDRVS